MAEKAEKRRNNPALKKTRILMTVPMLPATPIHEVARFYVEKLGFSLDFDYGDYIGLERSGVPIHLFQPETPIPPEQAWTCYVYVQDIEDLYETYRDIGAVAPHGHLESKAWGVREFVVLDPCNNAIRFGEVIEE